MSKRSTPAVAAMTNGLAREWVWLLNWCIPPGGGYEVAGVRCETGAVLADMKGQFAF